MTVCSGLRARIEQLHDEADYFLVESAREGNKEDCDWHKARTTAFNDVLALFAKETP